MRSNVLYIANLTGACGLLSIVVMMNRRNALYLLGGLVAGTGRVTACLWDRDTLKDDIATQASSLDLILGQFPHHGETYYKLRIKRISKQEQLSILDHNDLAVAYVRVNDFASAEKHLAEALKMNPNQYETLSNIGVTAKKQGDFEKGAEYIKKALEIKPEGHMGLGDWYLKMLIWREKHEGTNEKNPPEQNFIGIAYGDSFNEKYYGIEGLLPKGENAMHPAMMVKNDQTYADGFLVFGDHLREASHYHLAFLADTKAMMLGHQNPEAIRLRRRAYLRYHGTFPGVYGKKVRMSKPWTAGIAKAELMINHGVEWLEKFKETESELLEGLDDERKVTFEMVEAKLLAKGVKKVRDVST